MTRAHAGMPVDVNPLCQWTLHTSSAAGLSQPLKFITSSWPGEVGQPVS